MKVKAISTGLKLGPQRAVEIPLGTMSDFQSLVTLMNYVINLQIK